MVLIFDRPVRAVSSTLVGGGLGEIRSWLNLEVPLDYARTDPDAHLREEAARLPGPVAATMTAASVAQWVGHRHGSAEVWATVGLSFPLAAAGELRNWLPRPGRQAPDAVRPGTINIAAVVDAPMSDAALVAAVQTITEAKSQALADAGVAAVNGDGPATGTATDSVLVACDAGAASTDAVPVLFAGPATTVGHDLAVAVHRAIALGTDRWTEREVQR